MRKLCYTANVAKKEMVLCYGNRIKNIQKSGGKAMNEIIREIEAAQLKAEVPALRQAIP